MAQFNTATATLGVLICDIGIGAASSEVVLVADTFWMSASNERCGNKWPYTSNLDIPIPEGSRLAVRSQRGIDNLNSQFDVALYGWG